LFPFLAPKEGVCTQYPILISMYKAQIEPLHSYRGARLTLSITFFSLQSYANYILYLFLAYLV
jgi:hypothetical protein